ncbi:Catenin-beta-like protein [Mycena belliarum]|uniref:Catenin-beta-like protein n=1 Tax=Mycena belliarum TaxID=1033014 RepID=A0AAD6XS50_9AGAR|nr:Catenin-beta-like protein [Mycena belliae]
MDIDKLFKVPNLPPKRKLPDNPSPDFLKKMRMEKEAPPVPSSSSPSNGSAKGKRSVTMEEVTDEDEDMDREFAPGGDADYFAEEDDEGRFFGGGLTSEQKEILNIFDNAGGEGNQDDPDALSITSIRRMLLRFERAVNKNQDQRSKYPNDPTKFIDSEADLDSAIKALLPLAQAPVLAYPELVRSGTVTLLIGLLSHENADIVIDVVEVIHELTDEDVGNEDEDEDEERTAEEALKILIEGLLENSILELLVDNLTRLNEAEESDRQGVFHILGIFENILGFNPQLSTQLVSKTSILPWLLNRIQSKTHDENRGYAAELLSILLQNNQANRLELGKKDGVETFLKVLSQYRRRDPVDADETEFMENVFDSLCSALSETPIKTLFLAAEGPDLMVLIMKEKLQSRSRAIKTLDYAMSGTSGTPSCEAFVEALGLKTLFSALMGKTSKKQKSTAPPPASEDTSHILGILSSLFSNIPSESPARIRLLAKFVEGNYEKVDKLLEIRDNASTRLKLVDSEIAVEKQALLSDGEEITSEEEDTWYLRRLESGLFTLQTVDYILAWVAMEDDGIRAHLLQMLDRKSLTMQDIIQTLRMFYDNVDDEPEPPPTARASEDRAPSQKEILAALIAALDPSTLNDGV